MLVSLLGGWAEYAKLHRHDTLVQQFPAQLYENMID